MAPGKRRSYSHSKLAEAAAVKSGMSIRDTESEFGIPKSTIRDNAASDHSNANIGQPPELNEVGESMLKEFVQLLADWGFPFTSADLCHFVKAYLDKKGSVSRRFTDNLPTHRWVATSQGPYHSEDQCHQEVEGGCQQGGRLRLLRQLRQGSGGRAPREYVQL